MGDDGFYEGALAPFGAICCANTRLPPMRGFGPATPRTGIIQFFIRNISVNYFVMLAM